MNKDVHPLRLAYAKAIRKLYGAYLQGDKNPALTEQAAMKISRLGLDYNAYMDLAVRMCGKLASYNKWPYPYFSTVVSDKTISKVAKLIKYSDLDDADDDTSELFEQELYYATAYIGWWFGENDKPERGDGDVPVQIKSKVAEYLCRMYGVSCTTSNYNHICRSLEASRNDSEQ